MLPVAMQEQHFDLAALAGSEQTPFVQAHCLSASPPTLNVSREKQAVHTCTPCPFGGKKPLKYLPPCLKGLQMQQFV